MSKNNIVYFGNERLATGVDTKAIVLKSLVAAGYKVQYVVSKSKPQQSRKAKLLEIEIVAKSLDIPLLRPATLTELEQLVKKLQPVTGVLVAFGKIIPAGFLKLFDPGIINLHPSLLPTYRGPTPIEQALLDGKKQTGISLMQLSPEMDAGPIYTQETVDLTGKETKQELADKLLNAGSRILIENLPRILSGELLPKPQDSDKATYSRLISKSDGTVDWAKPAPQIEREIKAFVGWPGSRANLSGREVTITAGRAVPANGSAGAVEVSGDTLSVYCGQGQLFIDRLKPAGKREMSAKEFLVGLSTDQKLNLKT